MRLKLFTILIALTIITTYCGCTASKQDVKGEKSEGTSRDYPVKFNDAWDISKKVLYWEDCEDIIESRYLGYMPTNIDHSNLLVSNECVVGVWVDSIAVDSSRVTVVSKRKRKTQIGKAFTEDNFHDSFIIATEMLKKGQKVPVEKP